MAFPSRLFAADSSSNFKEDPRVKINRVILLFSIPITALDIYGLYRVTKLTCFNYSIDPLLQGFATLVPDLSLILVYYTQTRRHSKESLDRVPKDYDRRSFGNLFWRLLLLGVCLFWPISEVQSTGKISVERLTYSSCNSNTSVDIPTVDGAVFHSNGPGPTVQKDLIPFLKVARVRTSIFFTIALLMMIEMGISAVSRFKKVREDVHLAREQTKAKKAERAHDGSAAGSSRTAVQSVDTIELGAIERQN